MNSHAMASGRIAIVSHVHPSISRGGAEISAYALYQGLLQLGYDAIFIAAVPAPLRDRVALASAREFAIYFDPNAYDHFYHVGEAAVTDQLEEILEATAATVINFHHFMNLGVNTIRSVSRDRSRRVFVTLHEFLSICHNHGQMITRPHQLLCGASSYLNCMSCYPEHSTQQFALRRERFLTAFADVAGFIAPSRFLASRFVDWGIEADRISYIENGLANLPSPAPSRRKAGDNDAWIFGYFGQITPFKGLATLLDAADLMARYEDLPERISIRIHGNMVGQSEDFLRRFDAAVEKHTFLHYAGSYDNRTVSRLMSECDYIVMPSIWWENSPVVIQEAFAVGRPVICSGIGGMAEKVHDRVSGLHFRPRDHVDLLRVLELAASEHVYEPLLAGIPAASDATIMAQSYLDAGLASENAQAISRSAL